MWVEYRQCAAVSTQDSLMSVPPQKGPPGGMQTDFGGVFGDIFAAFVSS